MSFSATFSADGFGVEFAVPTRDVGMEDDLYQDIAKFFFQGVRIGILDRFQHFVSFLEKIWSQRLVRLLRIPWATTRVSEGADSIYQESETVFLIFR